MADKDNQNDSVSTPEWMDSKEKLIRNVSEIKDRFGNVFYFGNAGDFWYAPVPIPYPGWDYRKMASAIRDIEIRPDDILILSYPKTGLHWHREIITMLLNKTSDFCKEDILMNGFLDWKSLETEQLPSPRLLCTHAPFSHVPRQAFQKKIKIIALERNPKDALVSLFCQLKKMTVPMYYTGTFSQFISFHFECGFYCRGLFDYLLERQEGLEANPDVEVFTSVFEDLKKDPVGGVKKLNAYLGTGCSDQLCEKIALACSFDKMKPFKEGDLESEDTRFFRTEKTPIYRKGEVGDWKNWFTVAMNEEFDAEYNKRMSNYKRTYTYTL